ncbi:bacitracin ABC transporter ATP-binding protein [Lysinibacillus alkalisoli]|uniref:Bacitracin ABC transporter ATP-binding protein n=1 Tax=Lysinibacillus alkalisoli TaxID=1911548 RepID=A0A917G9A1_9BACI|nr:ABC transporter ATP-binding protein [Lysinibacillus alkalisoli]GGG30656.1 bacitracin ABC transporter ATP-binding protein [Lysinibacillus alkalisoli]
MYMVQTKQLTKQYATKRVVQNVNMHVKKGEIYGFLGPNGAGKTTIMKMLLNLIKPSNGEISINEKSILAMDYHYLKNIGSLIEYPLFYEHLTAKHNLQLHCAYMQFSDPSAITQALDLVGLTASTELKVKEFSLGMRQRLAIARAIVTKPTLLILDEPINGLDPIGIKDMRELLLKLKTEQNMTILLSSHILSEIECIADTIGIIANGILIEEVQMKAIKQSAEKTLHIVLDNALEAKPLIEQHFLCKVTYISPTLLHINQFLEATATLNAFLIRHHFAVHQIDVHHSSLEDYFIQLMHGGKQ